MTIWNSGFIRGGPYLLPAFLFLSNYLSGHNVSENGRMGICKILWVCLMATQSIKYFTGISKMFGMFNEATINQVKYDEILQMLFT